MFVRSPSPDGQHNVSGWRQLGEGVVCVCEFASLAGHTSYVCSVAFSPDG
jgi:WD40 repeat protein